MPKTVKQKECSHPPEAQVHFMNPRGCLMTRCEICGFYWFDDPIDRIRTAVSETEKEIRGFLDDD